MGTRPLSAFSDVKLSEAGRPILLAGEEEILAQGQVGLYENDEKANYPEGTARLTSHRLLFLYESASKRACLGLPLADVGLIKFTKRFLRQSPKITVQLNPPFIGCIKLSFRGLGFDEFFRQLQLVLVRQEWTKKPEPQTMGEKAAASPVTRRVVGIAGIQRKKEEERQQTEQEIQEAFEDLNSLMEKAKDMVALAQRMQAKMARAAVTADEDAKFNSYLLSLGIATPVTKEAAGTEQQYYRELARELADFLQRPLQDAQGTMLLTDVYCLYNRARGTQLISPDELLRACRLFEKLRMPVKLRVFSSGTQVVQLSSCTDEAMLGAISELFKVGKVESFSHGVGLTVAEYAYKIKVPLILAQEQLQFAEEKGILCRDDTLEALRFYTNLFELLS